MYRLRHGSTHGLPDVDAFLATLATLDRHPTPEARDLFTPGAELFVARAPGRLDLMGGIADYSGSLVLQLPLREAALVALQRDPAPSLRIVSFGAEANARATAFQMPVADFMPADGTPVAYERARNDFAREPRTAWAAYAAGALLVLMRERGVRCAGGARILVDSRVPEGKGVSSSAALEVAVMQAMAAALDVSLTPRELALLCQVVENRVVGAPCGVMDQMTAAAGEAGRLLALRCQPAELEEPVALPPEIGVWGLDSGVRHSVSGADYGAVRVGAFMGYRIMAAIAGLRARRGDMAGSAIPVAGFLQVEDPRWGGYLANVTPAEFEQSFAARLPERMEGAEFLARYDGTTDPVTRVDPAQTYAVRVAAAHPVYEHFRVRAFAQLLAGRPNQRRLELLGELMYQSHASYSACGLGAAGTDRLVELVRQAGPAQGLHGAKITGGGSGGTVAVLGRGDARAAVAAVAEQYARETGHQPYLFEGSSPGAAAFGLLRLAAG
jgi:L-arabinokinase